MRCQASKDGVCRNKYALGMRCDGCSDSCCIIRPEYEKAERIAVNMADSVRRMFGLKQNRRM